MAPFVERQVSLGEFLSNIFKSLAEIFLLGAQEGKFKANYPHLLAKLTSIKNEIDQLEKHYPEYHKWAKLGLSCAEYSVEGMKDLLCWNFETPYIEKARVFFNALIENMPKELEELEKEAESLRTKLKEAYNSAAEFYNDAKPYIQKIASAAKWALTCLGLFL